jgi:hypothetical protein
VRSDPLFRLANPLEVDSRIWFYSLMWERGKDKEPVEFLNDRGIVR